jgi:AraC family transcriptional regulator, arabinose operon regulatory protein
MLPSQALINYVLRHMTVTTNVCSRQQHDHGYTMALRTIPDHNFIYVTKGKVFWVISGKDYPLTPGELVIVPPGVEHHAYSVTQRMSLVSIHVHARLPGGQDVFEMLTPPMQQSIPPGSRLDQYFRHASDEFDRPTTSEALTMLPGWAHLVTRELFRLDAQLGLLKYRASDPIVAAMLEDLDRRLAEPVTLEDLAKRSGFSAQHLNRLFRKVLGVTPLQYLARTRMEHAGALLRDGRLTVRAVAQQVGFSDPYYFSRMFSAYHESSPSDYRAAADTKSPDERPLERVPVN